MSLNNCFNQTASQAPTASRADLIIRARRSMVEGLPLQPRSEQAAEGGCGVLGFAANVPIAGRHVLAASRQMHNRGNGKGGGIAMVGLDPAQARVDVETLDTHILLQVALLDPGARKEVEESFILPHFEIAQAYAIDHLDDFRLVPSLEIRPPDVWRYFLRAKPEALDRFAAEGSLGILSLPDLEDEFVYQNSFLLNRTFYASLGEKRAFVLSHGRNLVVLKIVGYAEDVVQYYCLEDQTAYVWISHQRYPTKGRVWHPGGAHPFIGLNEALVHNGDFANYHAVSEYLRQRNIGQLFLTDTEVSVQLFDLWDRIYGYPLEITLEAMAPTTEHDFLMLPPEKRDLYQAVQRAHIHGSPDGPWFFILARSKRGDPGRSFELLGITDTSMLRPQVFALYENLNPAAQNGSSPGAVGVQIGLVASERQAINACLRSLAAEDPRFGPLADQYWAARGGSHTDGGAFRFTVNPSPPNPLSRGAATGEGEGGEGGFVLTCTDKFASPVLPDRTRYHVDRTRLDLGRASPAFRTAWEDSLFRAYDDGGAPTLLAWLRPRLPSLSWDELAWVLDRLCLFGGQGEGEWNFTLDVFHNLHDRRFDTGRKKRASILALVDEGLERFFDAVPLLSVDSDSSILRLNRDTLSILKDLDGAPAGGTLILDTTGFPPEGEESAARWLSNVAAMGWKRLLAYRWKGGRFAACGLGPGSDGLRLDLYGDVGDYTASGLDGAEVYLHGNGQDQLGQIFKRGKLVVYGDVGQTFLYGAKGGEIFVLGSAAGRPLINAVGHPRAVINGTCLDYLAESFMAGDPHAGGGFVILNGVTFDEAGLLRDLDSPYPGANLFSLASGGAVFLRDPFVKVDDDQLNGGRFSPLSSADWALIEPMLRENERLFGIRVEDLLTVGGTACAPEDVYRKVEVHTSSVLREGENR